MKWLLLALALGTFVLYAGAIKSFFSRAHGVDARMKALQWAGTVSALLHLYSLYAIDQQGMIISAAAAVLYFIALAIFVMAKRAAGPGSLTLAFSGDRPNRLIKDGIYRYVRHPFYLAYIVTWTAGIVAALNPLTVVSTVVMVCFYISAARMEEQKFLLSELAPEYRSYANVAGLFWPKIRRS